VHVKNTYSFSSN